MFGKRFLCGTVVMALASLWLGPRTASAAASVTFVGSSTLSGSGALNVVSGPIGAGPGPSVSNYTFPDGKNAGDFGVLINETKLSAGTTACGSSCPSGPNANDYCDWNDDPSNPFDCPPASPGKQAPAYTLTALDETYVDDVNAAPPPNCNGVLADNTAAVYVDKADNPCRVVSKADPKVLASGVTGTASLHLVISSIPASTYSLVLYLSNPGVTDTGGCFQVSADGSTADSRSMSLSAGSGGFMEWSFLGASNPSTVDVQEIEDCGPVGNIANIPLAGFWIESSGPTLAGHSRVHVRIHHGWTVMTWRSFGRRAGFNVYARHHRLNHRLIVSRTSRFRYRVQRVVRHPRLRTVPIG